MFRVVVPRRPDRISEVVAEDALTPADRAGRGSYVGCIAGALSRSEFLTGLTDAGLADASVEFTHETVPGLSRWKHGLPSPAPPTPQSSSRR